MNDQQANSTADSEPTEPAPAAALPQDAVPPQDATPVRTAVRELLDRLRSENRVFRERLPMAIGIHRQLASSTGASAVVVRRVCALQSGSIAYLRHLCAGGPRYDLDGNVSGEVTPEQIKAAQQYLAKVLARKAESDARSGRTKAGGENLRPPRAERSTQQRPREAAATPKAPDQAKAADQATSLPARQPDAPRAPRPSAAGPRPSRSPSAQRPPADKARWQRFQQERTAQPGRRPPETLDPARTPASGMPPPRPEPRPTGKADPQSKTASAMALALSAALKSAPADFVPRAAPAAGPTPAPKGSASPGRRGRGASRGGSHSPKR